MYRKMQMYSATRKRAGRMDVRQYMDSYSETCL